MPADGATFSCFGNVTTPLFGFVFTPKGSHQAKYVKIKLQQAENKLQQFEP
jgi:hypothetical protein